MKVLVIGDTHVPFTKPGYWEWCYEIGEKHQCQKVIHIGDLTDQYVFSTFIKAPNSMQFGSELQEVRKELERVKGLFPKMVITLGNHDERLWDRALEVGIPDELLIPFQEFIGINWEVCQDIEIDDVLYRHRPDRGGKTPAINSAKEGFISIVNGHCHTVGALNFHRTRRMTVFGMSVGCGVDVQSYAMTYARTNRDHVFLGCGVVDDGIPLLFEWKEGYK